MEGLAQTLVVLSLLACWAQVKAQESASFTRLQDELLYRSYDRSTPPVGSGDQPVVIKLGVTLIDVVKADQFTNEVDLVLWPTFTWVDNRLMWASRGFSNITTLKVSADRIWRPDVVVFGQTQPATEIYPDIEAVLNHYGDVYYVPARRYRVSCDLSNLANEGGSTCNVKFGSWAYNGLEIDLQFQNPDGQAMDLSSYFGGSKIEVLNNTATRNVVRYGCCPEPYVDIQYKLTLRKLRHGSSGSSSFFGLF